LTSRRRRDAAVATVAGQAGPGDAVQLAFDEGHQLMSACSSPSPQARSSAVTSSRRRAYTAGFYRGTPMSFSAPPLRLPGWRRRRFPSRHSCIRARRRRRVRRGAHVPGRG
jgi:hypothetical protein